MEIGSYLKILNKVVWHRSPVHLARHFERRNHKFISSCILDFSHCLLHCKGKFRVFRIERRRRKDEHSEPSELWRWRHLNTICCGKQWWNEPVAMKNRSAAADRQGNFSTHHHANWTDWSARGVAGVGRLLPGRGRHLAHCQLLLPPLPDCHPAEGVADTEEEE